MATLIGSVAGLIGTAYGLVALMKAALLSVLLGFAARNRFRLTPALDRCGAAKAQLVRSVLAETVVGVLTVLAAGLLTTLAPAMHVQLVWPFGAQLERDHPDRDRSGCESPSHAKLEAGCADDSQRETALSLEAVSEEPVFRREVAFSAAAILGAVALMTTALLQPWRARLIAAALAAFVVWSAAPHLGLLFAPAYPTQFWTSPTGFSAPSVAAGKALYSRYCATCHGEHGKGDGPAAASLPVPPADLTADHLRAHSDGELFWWLSRGIEEPSGRLVMPGFAGLLTEDQRWSLIDWIRANNAGLAWREDVRWPYPVQAPGLALTCNDPSRTELADWRGSALVIEFGKRQAIADAIAVLASRDETPDAQTCVARDRSAAVAYATVTGLTPEALQQVMILVDRNGWLRAVLPREPASDRDAADRLARTVRSLLATPLPAASHNHMGMKM